MRTKKQLIRQFEKLKKEIAAKRDELRELRHEIEATEDSSERALGALDEATDALSELL
jgi:hypothetical protein